MKVRGKTRLDGEQAGVIFLRARNPVNARVARRGRSSRVPPREVIEKNYRILGC